MEYASEVWNVQLSSDIQRLERAQRVFTRRLLKQPLFGGLSYPERCARLGLETLQSRRHAKDLIMVFRILKGHSSIRSDDFFHFFATNAPQDLRSTGRRHPLSLAIPHLVTSFTRRSAFAVRVLDAWNSLPPLLLAARNTDSFGRLLSHHLSTTITD